MRANVGKSYADFSTCSSLLTSSALQTRPASGDAATRRRVRLGLVALAITTVFSAVTYSSPGTTDPIRTSLRATADRLLALQHADGLWPRSATGPGDIGISGRPARALLVAQAVLGDPRYGAAADRTARALVAAKAGTPNAASTGNLHFLAEYGRATGRPDITALAAKLRREQLEQRGTLDPVIAARAHMARANRTAWLDGAWRNYLVWLGSESAGLARAVGDPDWANEFTLAIASTWVPRDDYTYWVLATGRLLEQLSQTPGPRARRLATVGLAALRQDELRPGIPWSDTPYDTYAYTQEAAASLQGLLVSTDPTARDRAREGLRGLALRQAPHGGWAVMVPLMQAVDPAAASAVPDPADATDETPELDADMVFVYAQALRSVPRVPPAV